MIASSHIADEKVHHIAKLNNEIKALRSQMLETREALMHLKMESAVIKHMSESGLVTDNSNLLYVNSNLDIKIDCF